VAYATQENKKLAARESNNVRCGMGLRRKRPATQRDFSKTLDFGFGFAVPAAARFNLAAFS
jgi:hypothetical protein